MQRHLQSTSVAATDGQKDEAQRRKPCWGGPDAVACSVGGLCCAGLAGRFRDKGFRDKGRASPAEMVLMLWPVLFVGLCWDGRRACGATGGG